MPGLVIVQVSQADAFHIGKALQIKGLLDTTGDGHTGYGGARNLCFLVAPIIKRGVAKGLSVMEIMDMAPSRLKDMLNQEVLSGRNKVVMGDDDSFLPPGYAFSKALMAHHYRDDNVVSVTQQFGRKTSLLSNTVLRPQDLRESQGQTAIESYDKFQLGLAKVTKWTPTGFIPGLSAFAVPTGVCMNWPNNGEENHYDVMAIKYDYLAMQIHHAGTRYYTPFPNHIHSLTTSNLGRSLGGHGDYLPWNQMQKKDVLAERKPTFSSLGEVVQYASRPDTARFVQTKFFDRLSNYQMKLEDPRGLLGELMHAHDGLPTMVDFLEKMVDGYTDFLADYKMGMAFRDLIVERIMEEGAKKGACATFKEACQILLVNEADFLTLIQDTKRTFVVDKGIQLADFKFTKNLIHMVGMLGGSSFMTLMARLHGPLQETEWKPEIPIRRQRF
ncbi:MAG: hypothetical protein ACI9BD_000822 [Candidatus Marinamargulisbacteria bacterium]|jgi:hypothetical protein